MDKLFLVAILSVGIISGVIVSPEIWAIVEPHITINMESGQTTKPFTINDVNGDAVFQVNTDSSLSTSAFEEINFASSLVSTVVGETQNSPKLLWHIDIQENGNESDEWEAQIEYAIVNAQVIRDSGTGICRLSILESRDDTATWTTQLQTGANDGIKKQLFSTITDQTIQDDVTDIALALYNTDGSTTCTFHDISTSYKFYKIPIFDYTRVI